MDATQLFSHVVRDLDDRVQAPADEYQIIRASGLLRLLLLDQEPLLTQAHPGSRVRFEVNRPVFYVDYSGGGAVDEDSGIFVSPPSYP